MTSKILGQAVEGVFSLHKFVVDMEKFKECNLTLDVNKEHIFNSREQRILISTRHAANIFKIKEDDLYNIVN